MNNYFSIGISPCPNDNFIFGAWSLGLVSSSDFCCRFFWEDVQSLNEAASIGLFDIVKMSAVNALKLQDKYKILLCGGAFGLSAGPKLVKSATLGNKKPETIAVPGLDTTAFALLKSALKGNFREVPMAFDDIAAAVVNKKVDAGLLIHETALVYEDYNLELYLDLGQWWSARAGDLPLPLGVIGLRNSLVSKQAAANKVIRDSLLYAHKNQRQIMPLVKVFSKELSPKTLEAHIKAYVNDFSLDMGTRGQDSLEKLKELTSS